MVQGLTRLLGVFASARRAAILAAAVLTVGILATIGIPTALGSGGGTLCQPGGASPACTVRAHNAFAEFESTAADGCTIWDTSVQAFEALARPGQGFGPALFLQTFGFNTCTSETAGSFSNIDPGSGNPVFSGTISFSSTIDTASASGTAPMFDDSGAQVFTSTVDLSWQAFGPTTSYIESTHSHVPGVFVTSSHTNSNTRGAVASGVITDAASNDITATPTLNALLQDAISGGVLIFKP